MWKSDRCPQYCTSMKAIHATLCHGDLSALLRSPGSPPCWGFFFRNAAPICLPSSALVRPGESSFRRRNWVEQKPRSDTPGLLLRDTLSDLGRPCEQREHQRNGDPHPGVRHRDSRRSRALRGKLLLSPHSAECRFASSDPTNWGVLA